MNLCAYPQCYDMFEDLLGATFVGRCHRSHVRSLLCTALILFCAHQSAIRVEQLY